MWQCSHSHDNDAVYTFSNPDNLYNHILLHHEHQVVRPNNTEIWEQVTGAAADDTRPTDVCPLCFFIVTGADSKPRKRRQSQGKGPQKRLKSAARRSKVTFAEDVFGPSEPVNEVTTDPHLEEATEEAETDDLHATSYTLGRHIAAHLQYLMFLSLRLMVTHNETKGDEDDVGSYSLAPESGASQSEERRAEGWGDTMHPHESHDETSQPDRCGTDAEIKKYALGEGYDEEEILEVLSDDIRQVPDTAPLEDDNWKGLWRGNPTPRYEEPDENALVSLQYRPEQDDENPSGKSDVEMEEPDGQNQETTSERFDTEVGENSSLSEERKRALLDSLRFGEIDGRLMAIKNAHAKTCGWLLKKSEYLDWLDPSKLGEHHSVLWIKGKPGTGKSTLMKFAFRNARKAMKDRIVISFFFNGRGTELEKSTIGMYRSLLFQLLKQLPALQRVFDGLVTWNNGGHQWNFESLKALFGQAVQSLGKSSLVCFIDALDNCYEHQIRDMVSIFEHVGELAASAAISFQVCFSSGHYPHITIKKGLSLVLEEQEGHSQDIISYLDSELKIGHSELANKIRVDLQEKASGVFIWVALVVEKLNEDHDDGRIHTLPQRLQDIPGDLHGLFRGILTRDHDNRRELLLCIQWVLFARQPLKPEQLYFAILSGVEPEVLSAWDPDKITAADLKRWILISSRGLAEVTNSKYPTVQFIHESVQDFLLKENGLREIWSDLGRNFPGESHEQLKQCCLNYMTIDITAYLNIKNPLPEASSHQAAELRQSADRAFPFLEYAVQSVMYHADAAEGSGVSQTSFVQNFQLADWIKLNNLFERHEVRRHSPNASFLYILAEQNMSSLIRGHPSNLSCFKVEDERYGAPIFAALATSSREAVRTFLKAQAETEPLTSPLHGIYEQYCEDRNRPTNFGPDFTFSRRKGILSHVAEKGDEVILAFLLASGKLHADSKGENDRTPLSLAAEKGHEAVVKLLLEKGANIESITGGGRTPLSWAAEKGHEAVIKLLLEKGANIESKGIYGRTPLSWAAEKGHEAVVKLLLEKGVSIESTVNSRTPLSWAAKEGHEAVVKLLLEKGANIESKDLDGQTPLSWASKKGREAVVKLLLEKGVNIESKDVYGRTPLRWAAEKGHEAVVKLLLEKGANIESNVSSQMPLSWAVEKGHEAVVKLLLKKGANIESKDHNSQTPLWWAAKKGREAAVKLLLEKGANIELSIGGRTPLSWAAEEGHEAVVKLLLEKGADIESEDAFGQTPLSWAAEKGHEAIVKLLLEKGAGIESKDHNNQTPLWWAAKKGHEAVVKLLLKEGANIESKDSRGQTQLLWAAKKGHEAVVKLLLKKGVNIESKAVNGQTPLSWAAEEGHEAVVKLLLEKGANIESKDISSQTPLSWAAEKGHEAVVKLLESYKGQSL